jgi:hypothetical protein
VRFRILLAISLVAPSLAAQTVVPPADSTLVLTALTDRAHDYHYLLRRAPDSAERDFYAYHLEEHLVDAGGRPGLLIVKHSLTPSYHFEDSLLLDRAGLVPLWEHMQNQKATLTLTYDGARVRRTRSVPDSVLVRSDTTYDTRVFAFNEQELVLRSLPLRAGYAAILPLYSEGSDSLEKDTVTVLKGPTPAPGSAAAWTVRFADPAIVEVYVIDDRTRQIISHEIQGRRSSGRLRVVG